MRKENYIRPTLSIVHFQPPLLYDASADDIEGEGWDSAKQYFVEPDYEEESDDFYSIKW